MRLSRDQKMHSFYDRTSYFLFGLDLVWFDGYLPGRYAMVLGWSAYTLTLVVHTLFTMPRLYTGSIHSS